MHQVAVHRGAKSLLTRVDSPYNRSFLEKMRVFKKRDFSLEDYSDNDDHTPDDIFFLSPKDQIDQVFAMNPSELEKTVRINGGLFIFNNMFTNF